MLALIVMFLVRVEFVTDFMAFEDDHSGLVTLFFILCIYSSIPAAYILYLAPALIFRHKFQNTHFLLQLLLAIMLQAACFAAAVFIIKNA